MKIKICLMVLALCFAGTSAIHAQEYGKLRALQQRAHDIVKMRNDFVVHVLTTYTIPYERNSQGAVVRINVDGRWQDITGVEILPILKESADKHRDVIAHEIFFYTQGGTLGLTSELTIR